VVRKRKKLVWWDRELHRWGGARRPDFEPDSRRTTGRPPARKAMAAIAGTGPLHPEADGPGLAVTRPS